jgi:hypothetical protein
MVAGAVLGGLVAAALGVSAAFILNAASFALSALLILPIAFPALGGVGKKRGLAALAEVWPLIRGSRLLWALLLLAVLWPLGGAVINVLLSIYAVRVFGAGEFGVGVLYGAVGVGLLLGGLFAHRLAHWERWVPIVTFALEGSGHMLASQAPNLALAALAIALATAAAGVGNACFSSLLMRAVPGPLLGRVYALQGTLSSVTFGLSLLVSGTLLSVAAPRLMGFCAGALIVLAALLGGALMRTAELPMAVPAT